MSDEEDEEEQSLTESGRIKIKTQEPVTTRLEVYSDAIFSIIATISILPAIEELREGGSFEEIVDYFFLYFVSFQFIVVYYREHNFKLNRLLEFELTDVILNALFLAILGLFPFVNIMIFENAMDKEEERKREITEEMINGATPIFMQIAVVAAASSMNFITTLWVEFRTPFEPHTAFGYVRVVEREGSLVNVGCGAALRLAGYSSGCVGVGALAIIGLGERALLGYLLCPLFAILSRRLIILIDRTKHYEGATSSNKQLNRIRKEGVFFARERALAFGDALFAIAATILAVNLRPPPLSGWQNLPRALAEMWPQFGSYLMSFLILTFWWFLNWRMLAVLPPKLAFSIHLLNLQFLCFVGALPVAAELIGAFHGTDDAPTAISIYCLLVCVIGLFQGLVWMMILRQKEVRVTKRYKYLIYAGIMIGPITTIPTYVLSLIDDCPTCMNIATLNFLFIPLVGLLLYILFSKKVENTDKLLHPTGRRLADDGRDEDEDDGVQNGVERDEDGVVHL